MMNYFSYFHCAVANLQYLLISNYLETHSYFFSMEGRYGISQAKKAFLNVVTALPLQCIMMCPFFSL